jgi:hypothetical protein
MVMLQKGDPMARSKKVGALWLKTSKDGKRKYFSGVINAGIFGDIQISILKNTFKEEDSNQPDYNILLVEPIAEQRPVPEDEAHADPDDDLPF